MPKQRLSDAAEDYLQFRRSMGLAGGTVRNDKVALLAFLTSVGNIYVENLTERHVTEHLTRASLTLSEGAMALRMTTLNGFCEWARRTKRARRDWDPMVGRRAPKRVRRERQRVHVSKFPALLDAAGRRHPRDRAYVAVGLYTLSRTSEIEAMRIRDVDLAAGYIKTKVRKSKLEDRLPISSELDTELRQWLTTYAEECGELQPQWYLTPARAIPSIIGATGWEMGQTVLRPDRKLTHVSSLVIKPALRDIGFTIEDDEDGHLKYEGAHTLRRSAARALYDRLVQDGVHDDVLGIVQAMMHHRNRAQTEDYLGITAEKKKRDDIIRGQSMYGLPEVTQLREVETA